MPSAAFLTELAKLQFQGNIVLLIDGEYYSQYQPDSGLTVDADKLGLVINANVSGTSLDIRNVKTSIPTLNFSLLDKDAVISSKLGASDFAGWQGAQVKFYFGFITKTGSFDFSDYELMATVNVNTATKITNGYRFSGKAPTNLMKKRIYTTFTRLNGGIGTGAITTINVEDTTDFPSSGRVKIDDEFFSYSGKTATSFTGVVRADLNSDIEDHDDEKRVDNVTELKDHAMNILLTDIILGEMAIDPTLVDSTAFTDLRDNLFSGEGDFTLYTYDIKDGLKYVEEELLIATNTRLIIKEGKISITALDQVDLDIIPDEIDEDSIQGNPGWEVSEDHIRNVIQVNWGWVEGTESYTRTTEVTDTDSITTYGEKSPYILNIKGPQAADGGSAIASDRASRLLARFSTPRAEVTATTHLNRLASEVGDDVLLTHRFIPQEGGSLGFSSIMEILSKSVQGLESNSKVKWKFAFTSYSGIRLGRISPSPFLDLTITDQKTFEVPDGTCYKVGYKLVLWDSVAQAYTADAVNTVASISGNILTMENDFTTTLASTLQLFFADYDEASSEQKAAFAYIAPNTNVFVSDDSKAYEIII